MKSLRLIPLLGALAFLGAATTASASPNPTMGKFSPGHQVTAVSNDAASPCNALSRACSKPDRFAASMAKSQAYRALPTSNVTKGRFKAVFVDQEVASIDEADATAPSL